MIKYKQLLFVLVLSLLCSACMTTRVNVDVTAASDLNLNQFNEPLPVVLKVYQLSEVQSFKTATFDELWKSDRSVLADSLITVEERTINPSETTRIEFEQDERAKFVGFVALFRDTEEGKWRAYQDLNTGPVKLSTSLDISVSNNVLVLPNGVSE